MSKLIPAGIALLLIGSVYGGPQQLTPVVERGTCAAFVKGSQEFQCVAGVFYFFDRGGNDGPSVDVAVQSVRLGWMLSNPRGRGFFAGNWEFLGEIFGAGI